MPPQPLVNRRRADTEALRNVCAECEARVEAARIIGASNDAIAEAIKEATSTFAPVAHLAVDVVGRLDKLCLWLRKWGVPLLAASPWVLWLMGVITPEAAKTFSSVVKDLGH